MNSENPYQKSCRFDRCGKEFTARRLNQEFCCREHHIAHNNAKARSRRQLVKNINAVLQKNLLILDGLIQDGKKETTEQYLGQLGFNFLYHTHRMLDETKTKHILFYYTVGIVPMGNAIFKIIKS